MNREPTAVLTALGALLAAISKAAVLLDIVAWDADQLAGISLVIDTLILTLGALFIRSQVTPIHRPTIEAGTAVTVTDSAGATMGHVDMPAPEATPPVPPEAR